ncbi:MAG: acyl-CoA thioesterase [Desulfobacterales bacterium]|nr:acyl-CoA thioesterase [Desulfobacterales bacterium]
MRPKPFISEIFTNDERYIREKTENQIWHRCRHRVLYVDTDRSQSVYHANYLHYFEIGRTTMMRVSAYSYREIEENGYLYPIIEVGVHYYNPLFYDDTIWIHTRPSTLERVKIKFEYVITDEQSKKIICKGFTKHCAVCTSGIPVEVDPKTAHIWNAFPKIKPT